MTESKRGVGWYSVSLDTLRGWGILLGVLVLALLVFVGYRYGERWALERQAGRAIAESRQMIERLEARPADVAALAQELATGRNLLGEAQEAYDVGSFRRAAELGRRSRRVLAALLAHLDRRGSDEEAHFLSVQGEVEYRSAGATEWRAAGNRVSLHRGDLVRTGRQGVAEIMFADGNLFTVRPETSLVISGSRRGDGEKTIEMSYGWVYASTTSEPGVVGTPDAEAHLRQETEAVIAYEPDERRGRFSVFRGEMDVAGGDGSEQHLGERQQVTQVAGELSPPRRLPAAPRPLAPASNAHFDRARTPTIVLEWEPVDGAAGYALQVGRNALFVDNVVEDPRRETTRATLGVRGEGSFRWRVAALAADGGQSEWSPPQGFRVAGAGGARIVRAAPDAGSAPGSGGRPGTAPPQLEILDTDRYGSIFIVQGRTDPGATVQVNGEPVSVDADGSFTKTIQLDGEGWSFIEIQARDAWGHVSEQRRRVFVESL
ncbi:MAG TPA: FecR domain-containing protein [Thermoanaerobaculia bacterium]|nr:FecR domain-containing protein [Thermoanaerobaculia bacterium]